MVFTVRVRSSSGMTRVLLRRTLIKERDEVYFHELARDLISGRQQGSLREELWDYTQLYDTLTGWDIWERFTDPKDKKPVNPAVFSKDELSDWIFNFQTGGSRLAPHAVARWKQSRNLPWLIAALRHADGKTGDLDALLAAAAQVPESSPGFEIVRYYRLSLMIDTGHAGEAREELAGLLKFVKQGSALNLFRDDVAET